MMDKVTNLDRLSKYLIFINITEGKTNGAEFNKLNSFLLAWLVLSSVWAPWKSVNIAKMWSLNNKIKLLLP